MKYNKIQGIILNISQFKEADKLVTIFSKDNGKINLLARGANKILSKKNFFLDTLNYVEFMVYPSRSGYDLIIETRIIDDFVKIKSDFFSIKIIYYFLEILNHFLVQEIDSEKIFTAFLDFLEQLTFLTTNKQRQVLIIYFQLKILNIFGFSPELYNCVVCQTKFVSNTSRIVNFEDTLGYICDKHFDIINFSDNLIRDDIIKIQRYLNSQNINDIYKLIINIKLAKQILDIQNNWLEIIISKKIKSYNLLIK